MIAVAACLSASLAMAPASAQVNTDPLRPGALRPGLGGGLDASVMRLSGNVDLLDLAFGARVQTQTFYPARPGEEADPPFVKQLTILMGNFHYTARGDKAFINQGLMHGRWMSMWHRRVGSTVFVQHQFNEFQRLNVRSLWGASVTVQVVHASAFALAYGSGYMLEYNRISVLPGASDPPQTLENRWSNFLGARLNVLRGQLVLQSTLYLQPRFDRLTDLRLLEELEAMAKLGDRLGFGAAFSVLYDSAPPTGVEPLDSRIATNIKLSF